VPLGRESAPVRVEIVPQQRLLRRIEIHGLPACLELALVDLQEPIAVLELKATSLASSWHACSGLRGELRFLGDVPPVSFSVPLDHPPAIVDGEGARCLSGVFLPGEAVRVVEDASYGLLLEYPSRLPWLPAARNSRDEAERGLTISMPGSEALHAGLVILPAGHHEAKLHGVIEPALASHRAAWDALGQ
jgi:hypothetical protein